MPVTPKVIHRMVHGKCYKILIIQKSLGPCTEHTAARRRYEFHVDRRSPIADIRDLVAQLDVSLQEIT